MIKAIMYHYVRPENKDYPYFSFLHYNDFCRQLDLFEEQYNIIHPNALPEAISNGNCKQGLLLTFDDGLKDHYHYVFPELKKRGLSAIFYISTGVYGGGRILDVHRLHLLLGKIGGKQVYNYLLKVIKDDMLTHDHINGFKVKTYQTQVNDAETQLVKRIMNYYIRADYRRQILDTMMSHFLGDEQELLQSFYLSAAEIKEMHDAGMIIGCHSVTHPVMSKLTYAEQQTEIVSSLQYLEGVTGGLHHRTFCYPYGGDHSFTNETVQILVGNRFLYSFSVEARDVSTADLVNRPHALPRFNCNMFPFGKIYSSNN